MDVVLCRNVLMYFTPEHAARVVGNLHGALVENGWLLVAPSETSQVLFRQFTIVDFPDAMFYRKPAGSFPRLSSVEIAPVGYPEPPVLQEELPSGEESRREEETVPPNAPETDSPIFVARALANQGEARGSALLV